MVRAVEFAHRSSRKKESRANPRRQCLITWLDAHLDRSLHGQDFAISVAAVRQAPVGGIGSVKLLVEIVGQVKAPAPRSQRISIECGQTRLMKAYSPACSSPLAIFAPGASVDNCRFGFIELFVVTEDISGYKI